eukprot:6214556-Pleurochrysis_carterae.AAC.1
MNEINICAAFQRHRSTDWRGEIARSIRGCVSFHHQFNAASSNEAYLVCDAMMKSSDANDEVIRRRFSLVFVCGEGISAARLEETDTATAFRLSGLP